MKTPKIQTFRLHPSGQFCCQWGGRLRYLGADPVAARGRYEASLSEWRRWSAGGKPRPTTAPKAAGGLAKAVAEYLDLKQPELVPCGFKFLREKLGMMTSHFGASADLSVITEASIEAYRAILLKRYSPKTVKHALTTAKQFGKWARKRKGLEIDLSDWPSVRVPPSAPKAVPLAQVAAYLKDAEKAPPRYGIYLKLAFLTGCRPAELVRMIRARVSSSRVDRSSCRPRIRPPATSPGTSR